MHEEAVTQEGSVSSTYTSRQKSLKQKSTASAGTTNKRLQNQNQNSATKNSHRKFLAATVVSRPYGTGSEELN